MRYSGIILFLLIYACIPACNSRVYDASPGEPADAAPLLMQAIAETTCRYSIGTLPNWPLWREFQWVLPPREAAAVREVHETMMSVLPAEQLPVQYARARFIASRTSCILTDQRISADNTQAVFTFRQLSPIVPAAAFPKITKINPKAIEDAWFDAYINTWEPQDTVERTVFIPIQYTNGSLYFVTDVEHSFAIPIRIKLARDAFFPALERGDFEDAKKQLDIICKNADQEICIYNQSAMDAAKIIHSDFKAFSNNYLSIESTKFKFIQPPNAKPYTSAILEVRNDSESAIHNIAMKTVEKKPQYCILQSERNQTGGHPAVLPPKSKATVYCALSEITFPDTQLEWNLADIR